MKIRLSKKFVLILGGGLVLFGASGAAAVLIGTDKILGPSYRDINGLKCSTLQTIKVKKDKRTWVRKYVTSDQPGDGMARVRTALRVARAVQQKEKADLVQIAMIDQAGPKDRAGMRGRMIGAQVVYIPDLSKVPEGAAAVGYSAYYLDGTPTAKGEYFGMRVDLPLEDVEHLEASLTDKADCIDPPPAEGAHLPTTKSGHGVSKPADHGAAADGHGEAPEHGAAAEHGETPVADGHGAAPAADGHGDDVAAAESGGFLSSITGMIFGSKEEPAADHGPASADHTSAPAEEHEAAPADGHAEAAGEHGVPKHASDDHAAGVETSDDHGEQAAGAEKAGETEKPVVEQGFLDQVKGMIFGGSSPEAEGTSHEEAKADAGHDAKRPSEPAPEPRTSAEGGKRWSNASDADEIHSQDEPEDHAAPETAGADADGSNEADTAGAAWLEKFRAQQAASATESAKH